LRLTCKLFNDILTSKKHTTPLFQGCLQTTVAFMIPSQDKPHWNWFRKRTVKLVWDLGAFRASENSSIFSLSKMRADQYPRLKVVEYNLDVVYKEAVKEGSLALRLRKLVRSAKTRMWQVAANPWAHKVEVISALAVLKQTINYRKGIHRLEQLKIELSREDSADLTMRRRSWDEGSSV
ncbi:hypothetical protein LTR66_017624, partial [Elasticomyces elasticus]